ncbi:MAG: alpha-amylase family glycosyl hydrolase [Firmicutes bacterium]|nr:alpha-amylase family glycosyl hydrolase [Bacillota bacterium]
MNKPACSGTFYHIFVHSFCDANGDGIGDLRGILSRLDYLEALGIEGLWLSPIHPSASYHKYDILDFYAVDPAFGTMADLEELVAQCHRRGIRVILDLIQNCSSRNHPAFRKALADPDAPERRWYWFDDTPDAAEFDRKSLWNNFPSWHTAENGTRYIGIYSKEMPDFNFHDPGIRRECKNVARFWLEKGIDGFRLDSAMHLFSSSEVDSGVSYHGLNIEWWVEFREFCRSIRPDCYLIGEVWTEPGERALYYRGLDSTFHFYLGNAIEAVIKGSLSPTVFSRQLESACRCARLVSETYLDAPFLSNHDMCRFAETTGFDRQDLKLSAAIYLTLEGIPFVYYGEELGMAPLPEDQCPQFPPEDYLARSRTAFPWTEGRCAFRFPKGCRCDGPEIQERDPDSLLMFYRRLIHLRRACEALRYGRWQSGECGPSLLRYRMAWGEKAAEICHNLSPQPIPVSGSEGTPLDLMTGRPPLRDENDRWILLPKHSLIFYK